MPRPKRPLYFMVKPPAPVAKHIADVSSGPRRRAPDLLHITLLPLGDRAAPSEDLLSRFREIGESIEAPPFRVVFDQLVRTGRTLALRGSEPMRGAIDFQTALVAALARQGLVVEPRYRFVPHVTIDYRADGRDSEPIDPISWLVEELLLVESVVGERRHIEHGRWALRARKQE